jgi:putative transposase
MPMKPYKPEQIVTLLRQIEVEMANGKTTPQACRDAQITVADVLPLKRLVAELSLEKQILKDVAEGAVRSGCSTGQQSNKLWSSPDNCVGRA